MKSIRPLKSIFVFILFLLPLGCSEDEIPVGAEYTKLLIGKWVNVTANNNSILTDASFVMEFKINYVEMYATGFQLDENNKIWMENSNYTFSVNNDVISIDGKDILGKVYHLELKIISLNDSLLKYSDSKIIIDGVDYTNPVEYTCKRITKDYSSQFVGVWYGKCTSENNNDTTYHYWEYFADGSYNYYYQDENNKWIKKSDNEGKYFLYQNLFVSNYSNDLQSGIKGKAYEGWNFSISGNTMTWTGLRENNKTVTYEMTRADNPPVE